ncbi:MAG: S8 family serine peptidase [Bdellovibrio sp.]
MPSAPESKTSSTGDQNKSNVTQTPSSSPLISGTPTSTALQDQYYSWRPTLLDSGLTLTAENLPSWLSMNSNSGELYGIPTEYGSFNSIYIKASKGSGTTTIGPFSIFVVGDPLKTQQWHLKNTGQKSFSQNAGKSGYDLNLTQSHYDGIYGRSVMVAVSDTGLEIHHPDLKDNVYLPLCKDYSLASPYYGDPTYGGVDGDHGTSVSGIIAARGWNNIGIRGVAPHARLAGLNYLESDFSTAITYDQAQGSYDVFNYSYGASFTPSTYEIDQNYSDLLKTGFLTGRNGKGQIYVKAAGNSFLECDYNHPELYRFVTLCSSHNANMDPDNVLPWMIVVGAVNAKGISSSYSSSGSSLWISAPGGEFGKTDPAIVTTDVAGCSKGYSINTGSGTDFDKAVDPLNSDCDYTNTFNGTSSAAPNVTGAVALLLEANPNLKARDIKHILATTATKIDANRGDTGHPYDLNLTNHIYEPGWITNAAGYHFHNWYGFGLINVDAAVQMAKTYSTNLGTLKQSNATFSSTSGTLNLAIPDKSATGVTHSIVVSQNYSIEAVQIRVNVAHGRPGDLGIELTSPSGTKSVLMNINNSMLLAKKSSNQPVWVADLTNFVMLSNAFYGERSNGTWTIKLIDGLDNNNGNGLDKATNQTGTLINWAINIIGH